MQPKLRIAYLAHTLRSDWNNGNAHFLRGLVRAMHVLGHDITAYEPESEWSIDNLRSEALGEASLQHFLQLYSELDVQTYALDQTFTLWRERLLGTQVVILHEWNPPALAQMLLRLRDDLGFKLLFHDTHHRASSSPKQIVLFGLERFDGVLAFGEVLRTLYRERFGITNVWTLHEAADTTVFHPLPEVERSKEVVWIGNWGEGERSQEITDFFLTPASQLSSTADFRIYGVRYPQDGLTALAQAGVQYGGYLPNLQAPEVYARAALTVHIPRQQYSAHMPGIPTIRVFEALACGIPLISAPWQDTENLFRAGDLTFVQNAVQIKEAMQQILQDPAQAREQAVRGMETVLAHHTCAHRAQELTAICQNVLAGQEISV
jgi:spore maturation protein CgeB